jgi:preprotein translocase subunit YajC
MTHVALAVLLSAAKSTKTTSSAFGPLLIILVLFGAAYFLFLRPNQQRQRKARETNSAIEVGDEILTVGGIVGRVTEVSDDRLVIVTGEEDGYGHLAGTPTKLVLVRQAVARKIEPVVQNDPDADWGHDEADHDHDDDDDHDASEHDEHEHEEDA